MSSAIIFFSTSILLSILTFSSASMNGMYIARTINEMSPDVLSNSIYFIDYVGQYKDPYYYPPKAIEDINSYIQKSLKGKINKYKISIVFYQRNKETGKYELSQWDYNNEVKKIDIYFECTYNKFFNYHTKTCFELGGEIRWVIKLLNILKIVF